MTVKTATPARYALTLLAGAGTLAALAACSNTGNDSPHPGGATASPAAAGVAAGAAAGSGYADGSYKAEGSYTSPGGQEKVAVSLTLAGGVVTAVTVTPESENPTGQQYQARFASGISAEIVGKPLNSLAVTKVSGSSLTSGGFNQAVTAIKADAKD
ncbi:FMN-binding protein [Rathayibacter toxicus]|uniref:FMN-binding domain-containing protein n=1 Tax=Rathayibacter toxicus TaxID=145458 RepID=A0A0C5BI53_9MICO|nr:FMN-binding protein [Rathayibacter toxicus]AJM77965.1 hypothetical protein TI83_08460 [Rathayibacter toxicus]ALS57826.1 hypothetical protein APU90_08620 [Rathayibacter toxicus]KKM46973.1 hypothetical protein VT73_01600 [Rathayibacter toxicus]PPG20504.1 hypothetical protein C5D15_08305 [Rathayibacter toxicus]PPG45606.1 hypothetical protein C5D16_08275 [Rathayibacter toxicus]